ncbi:MAG: MBL fold metallo-hydrolase [Clostridia bacterium]|nr:MBL fold metallo-hydrolase [Clostridia bacterium]
MRRLLLILALCLLPIFAYADLEVHFVDVGHGDCTILISNGEVAIVDGGPVGASETVFNYIKYLGITEIKYAFATHPETDHVGGLPAAFHAAKVHALYASVESSDNNRFNVLLETAADFAVPLTVAHVGDEFPLGDATITVLSPSINYNSINDRSLVLRITSDSMTVLLCGDAGANVEKDLINSGVELTADVLRVGHHGSGTSTSDDFLRAVSPRYAVISSADRYGDQQIDMMVRLIENRVTVLCTDYLGTFALNGNVIVSTKTAHTDPYPLVGNRNSRVFHYGTCESVGDMKEGNKILFLTIEDAVEKGYKPCKRCHPTPKKAQP